MPAIARHHTVLFFNFSVESTHAPMGSQTTAKTVFLLVSMVGWLIVGAALMYLFPVCADILVSSDLTHLWMTNLSRGGYSPMLAVIGGGIAFILTVAGNVIWYRQFDGKM